MPTTAVENLGALGLVKDKEPTALPPNAWTDMSNARCVDRSIASFAGYESLGATSAIPDTITTVLSDQTYITYGAGASIYSYALGGTETELGSGFSANGRWDSCVLGGVAFFTNGIDNPQYWGGAGNTVPLPYDETGTSTCTWADQQLNAKIIRAFRYHLFALDVTDCDGHNPRKVWWSHPAEPGTIPITWDPTDPDYDAGFVELSQTPGAILGAEVMRDALIIYKDDAIYQCTYTGRGYQAQDTIWNFRLVTQSTGLYARDCVCDVGGQHFFVGDGDIYLFDGNSLQSIADERVKDYFFSNVSRTNRAKAFAVHYERTGEVWLCYPKHGQEVCNEALVWDRNQNTWSLRTLPGVTAAAFGVIERGNAYPWSYFEATAITWQEWENQSDEREDAYPGNEDIESWDNWSDLIDDEPYDESLILGGSYLFEMDRTNLANGSNQECYARRTHLDLGNKGDWHMALRLYPRATGDAFQVRVGSVDVAGAAVSWSDYQTFTPGTDYKLDYRVTGRMHCVEFYSNADVSWTVEGYEIDYVPAGRR